MSTQTNNDLVHVRQMAQSAYDALAQKDPCTIYFVNLTGVFTEQSLGEDGDIYLGSKLLTEKFDATQIEGAVKVNGTVFPLSTFTGSSFVEMTDLADAVVNATIIDYICHITMQQDGNSQVSVECWLGVGHYEEGKYVEDYVIASAQTTLQPARTGIPCTANISLSGSLGGHPTSKFLVLHVEATGTITLLGSTTSGHLKASQVLIRTYKTLL